MTVVIESFDVEGEKWHAAVCYNAQSVAMLAREALIELDYEFERDKGERRYSKIMFVVPLPNMAYVYQYLIETDPPFVLETFDTQPNHAGVLHFVSINGLRPGNDGDVRRILDAVVEKMPRKPWQFFWSERFRTGLINSEYLLARKRWAKLGIE